LLGLLLAIAPPVAHGQAMSPPPGNANVAELLAHAVALEHGEGVPKDLSQAVALYCVAARAGDAEAQYRLGWIFANGRGVGRDDAVAASFFAIAADAGHGQAKAMLEHAGEARGELPACMKGPEHVPALPLLEEPDPFVQLTPEQGRIAEVVGRIAPRFGVEPRLALAVIAVESNFVATARSVKDARGLMQLIPETADRFNVRNVYNVDENVRGGVTYLRWLLAYYRGNVALAAAAYNAGEGAVDRWGGIPPYAETREYVKRVLSLFRSDTHPYDPAIVAPSPILSAQPPSTM
jgi:hypothetical protein